ncbi:MAG: hypothetical protein KAR35_10715 [Candidatus Heimdallarchaeota archaeon]|nr:hypothetical protein [Candidatus Heimdallarchaeota archaeon]MCK5049830.1 hypothetical protein [Candidatus Heimdallarchaeota archaeon]
MKKNLIYVSLVIILTLLFSNGSSITNPGAQTETTSDPTTSDPYDETTTTDESMPIESSFFGIGILFLILVLIFPPLLLLFFFLF